MLIVSSNMNFRKAFSYAIFLCCRTCDHIVLVHYREITDVSYRLLLLGHARHFLMLVLITCLWLTSIDKEFCMYYVYWLPQYKIMHNMYVSFAIKSWSALSLCWKQSTWQQSLGWKKLISWIVSKCINCRKPSISHYDTR